MNWPDYIFSEKEITDFKRRGEVAKKLKAGITWKNIKETTGAHLQTIAIISKRLKSGKENSSTQRSDGTGPETRNKRPIFVFGRPV